MMGEQRVQEALFYEFSLEQHVPTDHLLRSVDRFVDLSGIRQHLRPFYSEVGRPSIDPELMMRMLIVGYCMGIRSERRLCDEIHLNLERRGGRSDGGALILFVPREKPATVNAPICAAEASLALRRSMQNETGGQATWA